MGPRERAQAFCAAYGLRFPILLAPMAGACPVSLSIAVGHAGGMGAMGALVTHAGRDPEMGGRISRWPAGPFS